MFLYIYEQLNKVTLLVFSCCFKNKSPWFDRVSKDRQLLNYDSFILKVSDKDHVCPSGCCHL